VVNITVYVYGIRSWYEINVSGSFLWFRYRDIIYDYELLIMLKIRFKSNV